MNTMIIYDSVFGNTEKIAMAMRDALLTYGTAEALRVGNVPEQAFEHADLVIVGSPTRAFQATKGTTRFLRRLKSTAFKDIRVAAFDTRISPEDVDSKVLHAFVRVFGYAAKPIADLLVKKSGVLAAAPEGFIVQDSEGPLKPGEIERASEWARALAL